MEHNTIDIHDEKAKELAQILMNEKAIAILHLVEDRALSISEISRELNLPISTVSYHIDKMLKVGLVEVAGKKYGKRLQEVKLYRASNKPILLVPRKSVHSVRKKAIPGLEMLHVISLGLAGLISAMVYAASKKVLTPVGISGANATYKGGNVSVMSTPERMPFIATNTSTAAVQTATNATSTTPASGGSALPAVLAVAAFILTFLLASYLLRRRS